MTDLGQTYQAARRRICELVAEAEPRALDTVVPACPAWTLRDLVAHLVGIPEELTRSGIPTGDQEEWAQRVVRERRDVPVVELLARWEACASTASTMHAPVVDLLCVDAVVHEHDIRGTLGRPGCRDAPEVAVVVPIALAMLAPGVAAALLPPLAVDVGSQEWATAPGESGCLLHVDAWTALQALESRLTEDELLALPADGEIGPYVSVIAAHSPLPAAPLPR